MLGVPYKVCVIDQMQTPFFVIPLQKATILHLIITPIQILLVLLKFLMCEKGIHFQPPHAYILNIGKLVSGSIFPIMQPLFV